MSIRIHQVNSLPIAEKGTYIKIQAREKFILRANHKSKEEKCWDGTMFYSYDKRVWSTWQYGQRLLSDNEKTIYLRGMKNSRCSYMALDNTQIQSTFIIEDYYVTKAAYYEVHGNLMALFDYRDYTNEDLADAVEPNIYALAGLFANQTKLVKIELDLPVDYLPISCCSYMFYGCSALYEAILKLGDDKTLIGTECCRSMFENCSFLREAPALPSTDSDNGCYMEMFKGCTSLTKAPVLPAMDISRNCYKSMFEGCTSLTKAPVLPAMDISRNCYQSMFQGCTSLTKAPALPAMELYDGCYQSMFQGCTSLIKPAPWGILASPEELVEDCLGPGGLVPNNCSSSAIANMYSGCINLSISTTRDANHPYWFVLPGFSDSTASVWVAQGISATGSDYKVYWISEPCLKPPVKPYTDKYRISQEHLKANGVYYGLTALGFDPSITLIEISPFYINGNDDGWSNLSIRPVSSRENFDFTIQNPDAIYGVTYALIKIQEVQPVSTYSGAPI